MIEELYGDYLMNEFEKRINLNFQLEDLWTLKQKILKKYTLN